MQAPVDRCDRAARLADIGADGDRDERVEPVEILEILCLGKGRGASSAISASRRRISGE